MHEEKEMQQQNSKQIKVYVVGSAKYYASWITEYVLTDNLEEADVVIFTGGEDVNPKLYGEEVGENTDFNSDRDNYEIEVYKKAKLLNKKLVGICRGAQLLCVMSGGSLVQHMQHPFSHPMRLFDSRVIYTNSTHHQMQRPYKLPINEYNIVAYAEDLSKMYLNGYNSAISMKKNAVGKYMEPEIVHYLKTNALAIQGHPEQLSQSSDFVQTCNRLLELLLEDKLDVVCKLKMDLFDPDIDTFSIKELESMHYNITNPENVRKEEYVN